MVASSKLPESPAPASVGSSPPAPAPSWSDVEALLDRLASSGASVPTPLGPSGQIVSYQRGRRLMLDSETGSRWIAVEHIHECWQTFERLGTIRRRDVLEPGRCSAFIVALFAQVPGVVEQGDGERCLVLPA